MNVRQSKLPLKSVFFGDSDEALCDGTNGTPDMRDRYLIGASDNYPLGSTGGQTSYSGSHSHSGGTGGASSSSYIPCNMNGTGAVYQSHWHNYSTNTLSFTFGEIPYISYDLHCHSTKIRKMWDSTAVVLSTKNANITQISSANGRYIVVKGPNHIGTGGGANSWTHTHSITDTGIVNYSSDEVQSGSDGQGLAYPTDSHTHSISGTSATVTVEPNYTQLFVGYLNSALNVRGQLPSGFVVGYLGETIPEGWQIISQERVIKCGTSYTTGGNPYGAHSHPNTSTNTVSITGVSVATGSNYYLANPSHNHSVAISSANALSTPYIPPYYAVNIIEKV